MGRIKMARGAKGIDIQISVQHVLNFGNAGSYYGGEQGAAYQWVSSAGGVAYTTGQPSRTGSMMGDCFPVECSGFLVAKELDSFCQSPGQSC